MNSERNEDMSKVPAEAPRPAGSGRPYHASRGRIRLWRRREMTWPTWQGWLLLLTTVLVVVVIYARTIHGFLALNNGKPGGILIVEGWSNDATLRAAMRELHASASGPQGATGPTTDGPRRYDRLYVTGGPISHGAPLNEYRTYAGRGLAVILALGFSTNEVTAVPAPAVRQDRTYVSAVSLREFLATRAIHGGPAHLITEGPHARRSQLLFQKALGRSFEVTVTAAPTFGYDPKRWWTSSPGVRGVLDETIAYIYARLFFWPRAESFSTSQR